MEQITQAEWSDALDRARVRYRRLAAYHRRTAKAPAPKVRASDIAPRRIGDGIKPNHRARTADLTADLTAVFPLLAADTALVES